jgi:two-component system, chemotaxis family, chemotaxis protein CheY
MDGGKMTIKVLAIDDSRTIRGLVQKVMQDAGYDCICAEDGVQGVARFADENPDVVITDVNMPNMDGFGVIAAIRGGTTNSKVPILVLTTESADSLKDRARAAGATGWIVKPFEDATIISVIQRVTGARS